MDIIQKWMRRESDKIRKQLHSPWELGWHDRGMGHGDFGIILSNKKKPVVVIIPNLSKKLAEHIITLHNASHQVLGE